MKEIYLGINEYKDSNYPGRYIYYVSNLGNIKNYKGQVMKQHKNPNGYMMIDLHKNGERKKHLVHRLVLTAFKANIHNKSDVNHINEDKTDNRLVNLEWSTRKENLNHGTHNERMANSLKIKVHCIELNKTFDSAKDAAIYLNKKNGRGSINKCCTGKYKSAFGYHWCYAEDRKNKGDE